MQIFLSVRRDATKSNNSTSNVCDTTNICLGVNRPLELDSFGVSMWVWPADINYVIQVTLDLSHRTIWWQQYSKLYSGKHFVIFCLKRTLWVFSWPWGLTLSDRSFLLASPTVLMALSTSLCPGRQFTERFSAWDTALATWRRTHTLQSSAEHLRCFFSYANHRHTTGNFLFKIMSTSTYRRPNLPSAINREVLLLYINPLYWAFLIKYSSWSLV